MKMTESTSSSLTAESPPLAELKGVCRSFGGVQALRNVSFNIAAGEVHAVCGENGAGKSTMIRLLCGVLAVDQGSIRINGGLVAGGCVRQAEDAGVAVMHQESTAFPNLNAVQNIFVGRELTRFGGLLLDHDAMQRRTADLLTRLGSVIPLDVPVGELPLAQRQMVALARALSQNCRLLIMDEPTASLSRRETETLLQIVRQLRSSGVSVLYVSHRLEEVFEIADRVTVLRDGEHVVTSPCHELTVEGLISLMVGRRVDTIRPDISAAASPGETLLKVRNLTRTGVFEDITFSVRAGEIVGITGLVGAGRSEIMRAIFGIDKYDQGQVIVRGEPLKKGLVSEAVSRGLALVPEDRQHEGLVLPMSVAQNMSLVVLPELVHAGLISSRQESHLVEGLLQRLQVRSSGPAAAVSSLSGGNQQKVVLGKWLAGRPQILLLDEPTRGVDVGAKAQVHDVIRELAASGMATIIVSSEMAELLTVSDRILVIRDGRLVAERHAADVTQEELLALSLPDQPRGEVG
jgi:rhamnose transport system ATP-binding protein